jgi:hypothetical protein
MNLGRLLEGLEACADGRRCMCVCEARYALEEVVHYAPAIHYFDHRSCFSVFSSFPSVSIMSLCFSSYPTHTPPLHSSPFRFPTVPLITPPHSASLPLSTNLARSLARPMKHIIFHHPALLANAYGYLHPVLLHPLQHHQPVGHPGPPMRCRLGAGLQPAALE